MNEMNIITNLESPQEKGKDITISIENEVEKNLTYKFLIGNDGMWETIKGFSIDNFAVWKPIMDGKYIIMVQAKVQGSKKPFDYMSRSDFIVGKREEKLIKSIEVDKNEVKVGEKVTVTANSNSASIMYRYWIKENSKWILIKDYTVDNSLSYTPKFKGDMEFLVECKSIYSSNLFDDFNSINFTVLPISKLEIKSLKCISPDLLVDEELTFEVEADFDESRVILYKFLKFDDMGNVTCLQDYSTRRLVSYRENHKGEYKILCLVKDMYSPNEYDDRALIHYKVYPYKPIELLSFTTDLSSPQVINSKINLKVVASGGRDLLYKFIVDGNENYTTKFTKENNFLWEPTKSGEYNLEVYIKDRQCEEKYEVKDCIKFKIEEDYIDNIKIEEIILDKKNQLLINEPVEIRAIASGGTSLKYSFVVKKDDKVTEKIDYSDSNTVYFAPEEVGKYEIDIRVRDSRSKREYDVHAMTYIDCYEYIPAKIDYVLTDSKSKYLIGDEITLECICENTLNTLIKYNIKINNHDVEKSEYFEEKKFKFIPRCGGKYIVDIMAKNKASTDEYDYKKTMIFNVLEGNPISNCSIGYDKDIFKCNEGINFKVNCDGGKDVIYEFYLMEKGEWNLIQRYSKKDYYTFIPFKKGFYKILALVKSTNKKIAYEDYDLLEFKVNQ
ncbi:triple tyrosine motif-containing protein [Clostridium ihumii]|uniref:triple tyrosine motif-containing protein n=1 Tax=Clostridium ihumii TaxID=1470356 RepID=UPI00058B92C8|nr:triple tyrosine motif-containing protein [Clostridium ihumii]